MAEHSKIEWTDATWNIVTGCELVSPGCTNCYAMKLAGSRLRNHPSRAGLTRDTKAGPVWTGEVRFNAEWLDQPLDWKRPRMIFVAAHGDLFHPGVTDAQLDQVFAVMALCPQHTFQVLTKRPERARAYLTRAAGGGKQDVHNHIAWVAVGDIANRFLSGWREEGIDGRKRSRVIQAGATWPLPNVWLGTSVETQHWAEARIPHLLETPAAVRWISVEPLLGPLDLEPFVKPVREWSTGWMNNYPFNFPKHRLDWVVAGGESGPGARPMHPDWARALRDQCAAAGVPFFFKQWGAWLPVDQKHGQPRRPVELEARGDGSAYLRLGKKAAGRLLDGVEHNGVPS